MIHSLDALPEALPGFEEVHPPMAEHEAVVEAERCLQCGGPHALAPCMEACPAKVDVAKFILQIREGKPADASETIFEANPLGGTCARVCPVEELCEGACVMRLEGRHAIEIGRLQRFATDCGKSITYPALPHSVGRVAVIGAGPAGLACASELARKGCSVEVFEKRSLPGGLATYSIAPYKQQMHPIEEETARIEALGVTFRYGTEVGVAPTWEEVRANFDAVFLGVGMGPDSAAGLPGEDLAGYWESLPFIEAIKLGRGPEIGRNVLVIGGGNTAIDVVREAVRLGAEKVTLVYRRDEASMPAFPHEVAAARAEGVEFEFLAAPSRILGEDRVRGLECRRMELGEPDGSGRRRPVPVPGSEFLLDADTIVAAIGQRPLESLFQALGLEIEAGLPRVDGRFATSDPKFFAGGDCVNGGNTVVEAVRHGKVAAAEIFASLSGEAQPMEQPVAPAKTVQEGSVVKHYQGDFYVGTSGPLCKGCNLCIGSCPSHILYLDGKNKIQVTDANLCVFCGICEQRCPDFAIWIHREAAGDHPVEVEAQRRLAV